MPASLKSRIPEIIASGQARADAAVERTAYKIQEGAQRRSRVDTGLMRASWEAIEVEQGTWSVGNPVYYTIFNEFGTVFMSAQPMLIPALQEVIPEFVHDLRVAYI